MKRIKRPRLDVNLGELDKVLDQAREAPMSEPDCNKIKTVLHALAELVEARRRQTEKTKAVVGESTKKNPEQKPEEKPKGHGRKPAAAYEGAVKVAVPHAELNGGDACPECPKGKVYTQKEPKLLVRIVGQPPLAATVYELERLRCNACGQIFTAATPEGVGLEKFDETAVAMMAQLKYGSGMPFNRVENLERLLGIPLPASTQWDEMEEAAELLKPAMDELIRAAGQGELVHNDDTGMRVLHLERPPGDERTGVFTSGIVSKLAEPDGERTIALFFTGPKHAGENLGVVLGHRAAGLAPPIQMCDALSRNVPKLSPGILILLANCLAHGRRQFVDIAENFPEECLHVLETLGEVYGNDAAARGGGLTPEQRLAFHRERSGPVMEGLHGWCEQQLAQKKTEPNSGLGKAIAYLLRHWKPLTLFLRQAGAPLDNNICERAIKRAVLHRKNALFYRTLTGAGVGDLFMSLIHTCDLNGVNSFHYLTELLRHPRELQTSPADWQPWNYRAAIPATRAA